MQTPVPLKRNGGTLIPGELDLVLGMQTPVPFKQTLIPGELDLVLGMQTPVPLKQTLIPGELDLVLGTWMQTRTPVALERNGGTLIPGELCLVLRMQTPAPVLVERVESERVVQIHGPSVPAKTMQVGGAAATGESFGHSLLPLLLLVRLPFLVPMRATVLHLCRAQSLSLRPAIFVSRNCLKILPVFRIVSVVVVAVATGSRDGQVYWSVAVCDGSAGLQLRRCIVRESVACFRFRVIVIGVRVEGLQHALSLRVLLLLTAVSTERGEGQDVQQGAVPAGNDSKEGLQAGQ